MRVATQRGFGVTSGDSFTRTNGQMFVAHTNDGAELDLSGLLATVGRQGCERIAEGWGRSIGALRTYRPKASHRRFLASIRSR